MARESESGLPIEPVYGPEALEGWDPAEKLGEPGAYPFTRGVYPSMYTGRPWTMRQYAGFGTAAESNARYQQLIANGTMGLSVAFDLPTQMGHDSDAPIAHGEVGKVGVAIDSIDDMRVLFGGIPLDKVSTSMTINAPAALLLLLYQLVGEEQGVPADKLTGTIQNDVLKEYIARGTYIFPPKPSLRLIADIFKYCRAEIPKWNTISISGYHMAEAGASPAQEIAFTLADGIEYVRTAVAAGMDVDDFAPAPLLLLRRPYDDPGGGRQVPCRPPDLGAGDAGGVRREEPQVADAALPHPDGGRPADRAAARGEPGPRRRPGPRARSSAAPSRCTPTPSTRRSRCPTDKSARLALRTQQVLAYETDVTATVDPFAGSYVVEKMTDDVEAAALDADAAGRGPGRRGQRHRARLPEERDRAQRLPHRPGDRRRRAGRGRRQPLPAGRGGAVRAAARRPGDRGPAGGTARAAAGRARPGGGRRGARRPEEGRRGHGQRPLPDEGRPEARATVGEVCNALREVWGTYVPTDALLSARPGPIRDACGRSVVPPCDTPLSCSVSSISPPISRALS